MGAHMDSATEDTSIVEHEKLKSTESFTQSPTDVDQVKSMGSLRQSEPPGPRDMSFTRESQRREKAGPSWNRASSRAVNRFFCEPEVAKATKRANTGDIN